MGLLFCAVQDYTRGKFLVIVPHPCYNRNSETKYEGESVYAEVAEENHRKK